MYFVFISGLIVVVNFEVFFVVVRGVLDGGKMLEFWFCFGCCFGVYVFFMFLRVVFVIGLVVFCLCLVLGVS